MLRAYAKKYFPDILSMLVGLKTFQRSYSSNANTVRVLIIICYISSCFTLHKHVLLSPTHTVLYAPQGVLPSQLLLLLKTNDCLRHIDKQLGTPVNSAAGTFDYSSNPFLTIAYFLSLHITTFVYVLSLNAGRTQINSSALYNYYVSISCGRNDSRSQLLGGCWREECHSVGPRPSRMVVLDSACQRVCKA